MDFMIQLTVESNVCVEMRRSSVEEQVLQSVEKDTIGEKTSHVIETIRKNLPISTHSKRSMCSPQSRGYDNSGDNMIESGFRPLQVQTSSKLARLRVLQFTNGGICLEREGTTQVLQRHLAVHPYW